mgnify:CR=1 FL=1
MKSLRTRLLLTVGAGTVVLLLVFGIALYAMIRHALVSEFDERLRSAAQLMMAAVDVDDGAIDFELDTAAMSQMQGGGDPLTFSLWTNESPLLHSDDIRDGDLPRFHGTDGEPGFRGFELAGIGRVRAIGVRFTPRGETELRLTSEGIRSEVTTGPTVTLVVARSTRQLEARLAQLAVLLLVAAGCAVLVGAGAVWFSVGGGLKPLRAIAARIAAIREDDLSTRLETDQMPVELAPVGERINDLLARLDVFIQRERGFSADVAHELRTPLAGLRATIEVALGGERNAEDDAEAMSDALQIVARMETLVERLLMLARLDAGRLPQAREPIRLVEVIDACLQPLERAVEEKSLSLLKSMPNDPICSADRTSLILVLTNLLENAVEYSDEGGQVRISSRSREDGRVELTIANSGCRLSADEAAQVFERFWRADAARSDTGRHYGLGLPIVRRMVAAMKGSCSAEGREGEFLVTLTLPGESAAE